MAVYIIPYLRLTMNIKHHIILCANDWLMMFPFGR